MKKFIVILLILAPCLCFGQRNDIQDIKMSKEMKTLSVPSITPQTYEPTIAINLRPSLAECICYPLSVNKEEYDVIVFDAGYESFLATQKSKDFYTESFLKAKNMLMVNEWNYRYRLPRQYNPNIYEVSIDYDTNTDYGLDVEYKIYMFFRFMEKEHNMSLIGDRLTAQI